MEFKIQPFLTFDGECEEAFNFYKTIFGNEFAIFKRFSDMPPQEGMPVIPSEYMNRIMYIALPINKHFSLCGADIGGGWERNILPSNNTTLVVRTKSKDESDYLFHCLSKDGKIIDPLGLTFLDAYSGMCIDKYGINWMINENIQPRYKVNSNKS